jgi:asparagine synthase (glutamine-hydrolysing)
MMHKELFGVFGDAELFSRLRSPSAFDRIVEGERATVGVRDAALDVPDRTATFTDEDGTCVIWGEAYAPDAAGNAAEWLLGRYRTVGAEAFSDLNGSYLAFVDTGGTAAVVTDPVRSWECYYTDAVERRVFGTDPAAVASFIDRPTLQRAQLLEFAHLGLVLGDETLFRELRRVPLDGRLRADATEELRRFVYRPQEFDYVGELARRLERAIQRRTKLPGRKGLLLSAGFDSRTILAGHSDLDVCYTVSAPGSSEADVAERLSRQYGTPHRTLDPDGRYLNTEWEDVRYAHGIKESLHIHHGGNTDEIDADTVYHGLLFDTFFRGHFLPRDDLDVLGYRLPSDDLEPDPDPVTTLLTEKFGYIPAADEYGATCPPTDDGSLSFARDAVARQLPALEDRFESAYDATALVGIQNQPTTTFRTHLADHFLESFVAVDAELLAWHLSTPPEYRNTDTLVRAIERLDSAALRHRPPDRPRGSQSLNAIEQFVRSRLPLVSSFERSWPDRRRHYRERGLDRELFPAHPELHDLPVRLKLRLNDATRWVNHVADGELSPTTVLRPPAAAFPVDE